MPCDNRLAERAAEAAAKACCTRCGALMMQRRTLNQLITGTFRRVGEKTEHFNLCSGCTPAFVEFLAGS